LLPIALMTVSRKKLVGSYSKKILFPNRDFWMGVKTPVETVSKR
jgi:hypothetical protein